MRNTVLALLLASSLMAAPAYARDGSMYVGLQGGVTDFGDVDVDVDQTEDAMIMTTNTGWEYGALAGYDFGNFRLEAEGTRKTAKMQQLRGNGGFDTDNVTAGVQELASIRGDIEADALMANALFDIGGNDGVGVYAGAGIGYAWTRTDGSIDGVVSPFVDDKDNGFAWQLVAGLTVPMTRHVDLGARYRYFNVGGLNMNGPLGREYEATYSTHSLLATLTFHFGGSPPPPPRPAPPRVAPPAPAPAPAPAPPPPPQMKVCADGSRVPVAQNCPAPPPPPVQPTGERG